MSKKQISVYKFLRIAKNKKSVKVRGLYLSASFSLSSNPIGELEMPIEAYTLGDHIYMWKKSKKQSGNYLKTHFVRYKLGSVEAKKDWVSSGGKI